MLKDGKWIESCMTSLQTSIKPTRTAALDSCVICLDEVSEQAVALPCKHDNFDFLCLITWLQETATCPLCKASVASVEYKDQSRKPRTYRIEESRVKESPAGSVERNPCIPGASPGYSNWIQSSRANQRIPSRQFAARRRRYHSSPPPSENEILLRRQRIYELGLYSLHVGSNRLSGYSDMTPNRFANSPHLISRARKWIRRELQVFGRFAAAPATTASGSSARQAILPQSQRASSNAEFLLDYIIAILKTVDIKGSKGQAQAMLVEFLGDKSALFLHELNAWLRSPFEELSVWDRNVRYEWPEGEERALKRTAREQATEEWQRDDFNKRRRIE